MANNCDCVNISGKHVCTTEHHHEVLLAWAGYRRGIKSAPILITLDHHTDTRLAFLNYLHNNYGSYDRREAKKCLRKVCYRDDNSITNAISILKNDEHIDVAVKTDIIKTAFIIQYDSNKDKPLPIEVKKFNKKNPHYPLLGGDKAYPQRPFSYPDSPIYIIGDEFSCKCDKKCHDEECRIIYFNNAIESDFLNEKINRIREMKPKYVRNESINHDYILDIDLDYFHTMKSIHPEHIDIFYDLIRNASLITIAIERVWIEEWKSYYDKDINSGVLINELLKHIDNALK